MIKHHRLTLTLTAIVFAVMFLGASVFAQSPFGQQQQSPFAPPSQQQKNQQAIAQAQKRFQKAIEYQKAGKLDAAATEYKAVLKVAPNFVPALNNLGLIYLQKQQAAQAEATFRKVLKVEPGNQFAQEQMPRILMARNKPAEALTYARKTAKAKPKDFNAQFMVGIIAVQAKNFQVAVDAFRSAAHIKPDDLGAQYNLGFAYIQMKKYAEGREYMNRILKKDPQNPQAISLASFAAEKMGDTKGAVQYFEDAAKVMPDPVPALLSIARFYSAQKNDKKVEETFQRILKIDPNSYEANFAIGQMLYGKKKYKEAEPRLIAAKKANPKDIGANLLLAWNQMQMVKPAPQFSFGPPPEPDPKLKDALANVSAALAIEPKNRGALELKGYIMENLQDSDGAMKTYQAWTGYHPKDPLPNRKIASLYMMQGKKEYAYKHFGLAIQKAPKDHQLIAEFASAQMQNQDYAEAYKTFQKAMNLKQGQVNLMIQAATCLQQQKRTSEAISLLNKAIKREPENTQPYLALANIYRDDEPDKAIEVYNSILKFAPKDQSALMALAMVYDKQKKYEEQIGVYRQLMEADPKTTYYATMIPSIYDTKLNKLDTAIEEAKKLVESDPKQTAFRSTLANLLMKKTPEPDYAGAIEQYAELAKSEEKGDQTMAYVQIGEIYTKQKKTDEAIASYKKALDLNPSYNLALKGLEKAYEDQKQPEIYHDYLKSLVAAAKPDSPYKHYVDALKKADKLAEAVATLEEVSTKNPEIDPLSNALASAYSDLLQKDKAVELYKKMLVQKPDDKTRQADLKRKLGDLYLSMNRPQDAVDCYLAAKKTFPYDANFYMSFAKAYEQLNQRGKAVDLYREYSDRDPANQQIKAKLSELEAGPKEIPAGPVRPEGPTPNAVPGITGPMIPPAQPAPPKEAAPAAPAAEPAKPAEPAPAAPAAEPDKPVEAPAPEPVK